MAIFSSNHSLDLYMSKSLGPLPDPAVTMVASIWALYMCSILRIQSNPQHCLISPILLTLYVQYTKIPAVKKRLPFELISAVFWEYRVVSNSSPNSILILHFRKLNCPYMFSTPLTRLSNVVSVWPYMCNTLEHLLTNTSFKSESCTQIGWTQSSLVGSLTMAVPGIFPGLVQ